MADDRTRKLFGLFRKTVKGDVTIDTSMKAERFIDAVCAQANPLAIVSELVSSSNGERALQQVVCVDISPTFIQNHTCRLLKYFRTSDIQVACNGTLLKQIVEAVVTAPFFWTSFVSSLENGMLDENGVHTFAWLLLQLVSLPVENPAAYTGIAVKSSVQRILTAATQPEIRNLNQKINQVIANSKSSHVKRNGAGCAAGGRHDNDYDDFRQIQTLPTVDELASSEPAFLRFANEIDEFDAPNRLAAHLDNQYRLLREDMVRDLRDELESTSKPAKGSRAGYSLQNLRFTGIGSDEKNGWFVSFSCHNGIPMMPKNLDDTKREQWLRNSPKILANEVAVCLISEQGRIGLGSLLRKEADLAASLPIVSVILPKSDNAARHTMKMIRSASSIKLIQLNTTVFAYEPVLRQLQGTKILPLASQIMEWEPRDPIPVSPASETVRITQLVEHLIQNPSSELKSKLDLAKSAKLDASQADSLIRALTQEISLIQGPPGTGKSFIGALIAKCIHTLTDKKMLVVCYTNHALDQFLEDLLDIGLDGDDIVRLGSGRKASEKMKPYTLYEQTRTGYGLTRPDFELLNSRKALLAEHASSLQKCAETYLETTARKDEIMDHLYFSDQFDYFHNQFDMPQSVDGFEKVTKSGKQAGRHYLLDRWGKGKDAGIFRDSPRHQDPRVWSLTFERRRQLMTAWGEEILQERLEKLVDAGSRYDRSVTEVAQVRKEKERRAIKEKRVIGCTTTAAAKYVNDLHSAAPEVVIVEEAGEILESHVLMALGPETEQLIMIGDHKQLRPKVRFDLSIEKGEGYDLNRSLFERLVLKGYPHTTLSKQHRMRPEISALVRLLTYPELEDAPSTATRQPLKGFQDSVIFVTHSVPEDERVYVFDPREIGSKSSKTNQFEANMTLRCVRYLAQQGYRSDQVVVLTPYLAQLRLLYDVLKKENDPVLNDMDSYDLVRAGILPDSAAGMTRRQLRISTVDNYQGEESDVVVVSFTRSNPSHDIGFLSAPERLNVLLSRAREGLIMVGNASTFLHSRKGSETWSKFLHFLREKSRIHDGFPVRCERHQDREAVLTQPNDFDKNCPDGGCDKPCGTMLNCGVHVCPQRCHQLLDHSNVKCQVPMKDHCEDGHPQVWKCFQNKPALCLECERLKKEDQKRQQIQMERLVLVQRLQEEHDRRMAELDGELDAVRRNLDQQKLREDQRKAYEQKKADVEDAKKAAEGQINAYMSQPNIQPGQSSQTPQMIPGNNSNNAEVSDKGPQDSSNPQASQPPASNAQIEWQQIKTSYAVRNKAMDDLMSMVGLEDVKQQFVNIWHQVETSRRQGVDCKQDRFGTVLLGNPGTGKTTVARLYGKFLASLGVLEDSAFLELSGSKCAAIGVSEIEKKCQRLTAGKGGVVFIDEAYQLTSQDNTGGKAVLDYLLTTIENTTGTLVFMFAGYDKQMEDFFKHNPGLDSRLPCRLRFSDYSETELRRILQYMIEKRYQGKMKVADGPEGLFMRIVSRRLHRRSGREGFGNARAMENQFKKIREAQASRLTRERNRSMKPDDFFLSQEDLIGPEPSQALLSSQAWKDLQEMVGLESVKDAAKMLFDRLQQNYMRELKEKKAVEVSLNRLFLGSPGTGKTTVAKIYGQILAAMGLLSSDEVVVKLPTDFVGAYIGHSEKNTKAILDTTRGKVLVIDEAYTFGSSTKESGSNTDVFRRAVIDTLVAEVQSTPGEDRAVLLLGYQDKMEEMLRESNPGLSRRFPVDNAFVFEDYDDAALQRILETKIRKQEISATDRAIEAAMGVLTRARRRPNFGNAGEAENLLSKAKDSFQKRQRGKFDGEICLQPEDFDADHDRVKDALKTCEMLFRDVVGSDAVVDKLRKYIRTVQNMQGTDLNPENFIPFNYLFKGPPGTGKTTTARKIGHIFYTMGFLASDKVVECSVTNLVAQYTGQTGPKVVKKLEEALGQVLFIDEAYRLGDGNFGQEALDELVDCLTKPRYKGKMIVVLAGYEHEIDALLKANPGLTSRFPEELMFDNLTPPQCIDLLRIKLQQVTGVTLRLDPHGQDLEHIKGLFQDLAGTAGWGNGRDIETLSGTLVTNAFQSPPDGTSGTCITGVKIRDALKDLLRQRNKRAGAQAVPLPLRPRQDPSSQSQDSAAPPAATNTSTTSAETKTSIPPAEPQSEDSDESDDSDEPDQNIAESQGLPGRDPGVTDEIWDRLQEDIKISMSQAVEWRAEIDKSTKQVETAVQEMKKHEEVMKRTEPDSTQDLEARRRHEQERIAAVLAKRRVAERVQAEEREKKVQQKLKELGVCCQGFRWIKQNDGYRCAGGSHFMSNEQIGV